MRVLCVDDNETKESFCAMYRLDPDLIDFTSSLNGALEAISNPAKRQQYDLVLLDVDIEGDIDDRYKPYLRRIVTEDKLRHIESGYGGFYLYLSLLYEGFSPNRIGFLSAYIDYRYQNLPSLPIQPLEELRETITAKSGQALKLLANLKDRVDFTHYRQLENMLKASAWAKAEDKVISLMAEAEMVEKSTEEENAEHINENFDAFKEAGVNIPESNQFSKAQNEVKPDSGDQETNLTRWIKSQDESGYYQLRYGMIQGCQHWMDRLDYMLRENAANIERLHDDYRHDRDKEGYIKALEKELLDSTSHLQMLKFYSFNNLRDYQEQWYEDGTVSFPYKSSVIRARYGLEYFRDMLATLRMLLPVREPVDKKDLYVQIVKMLTHPWEAAKASYRDYVREREVLFNNCISTVAKSVRNWTAHSRLTDFNEEDVAFIFIIMMRSYFHQELQQVLPYEQHLLTYVLKYDAERRSPEFRDLKEKLAVSLDKLNHDNIHSVTDINISNLFTEIGKYKDCPPDYLYRMFAHVAHYPYIKFKLKQEDGEKNTLFINFNNICTSTQENDIFSKLLSISIENGLKA
ncbi:response regulator [Neobacillus sp. Marseille-QA0830]